MKNKKFEIDISKNKIHQFSCDGGFKVLVVDGKVTIFATGYCFGSDENEPTYQHDCEKCIFLGWEWDHIKNKRVDLYYCDNEPTLVARFSDSPEDYTSGINFCYTNRFIKAAKTLAEHLELM